MDWSLLTCARKGHITYAPDESGLRNRLTSPTAAGQSWRCLRCGTFVPGEPKLAGPAGDAPQVRRGDELRSVFILRLFAVERMVRVLVVGVAAYAVWRFQYSRGTIQQAFNRELPLLRPLFKQLGYDLDQSKLVEMIRHAFNLNPTTLRWFAVGLAAYTVIEVIEAVGLWLAKRWGEYFAMVATSAGLPLEIYELANKVTFLRVGAFLINVALVVYLVYAKRLFGIRGGGKAYQARRRSESIIDAELQALAKLETADAAVINGASEPGEEASPAPARPATAFGGSEAQGAGGTEESRAR
ncbi:MAG TPA: DUF2127 domain-containing protein [Streptosporangiaceae bacterium]|nr:DUF2127 domain-containing protein [Streptosporangiaceae bacterium]